jgi:type IV pilus assembly protein PilV
MTIQRKNQAGVSLIEVLVAILILSFGMLALASMLAFAVQLPKLSGYRSTATILAASHIERMRANPQGFSTGSYEDNLSYDGTSGIPNLSDCTYPTCSSTQLSNTLATMDIAFTRRALRRELPAGGMRVVRATIGGTLSNTTGDLWIVWNEPSTFAGLNPTGSDNCPTQVTGTYTNPKPRCLYMRFDL